MDSSATSAGPAQPQVWPARAGPVPPLADGFITRPESAPGLAEALVPGSVVVLAGGQDGPARAESCGKTQIAACYAGHLWRSGQVDLLAWVDASSRASVLSGYVEAAAAVGISPAGPAGQVAQRLAGWLAQTARRWLIVLDDLHQNAAVDGLWPAGPAGRVLVTARADVAGEVGARIIRVGAFSTREAANYLMTRLSDDPDQRHGALDLAITLGGDPCALTHAAAVLTTTTLTCRDYQHDYAASLALLAPQPGGLPPAAVTWALSARRAGQLCPGGTTWLLLALAAQFGGQPIPGPVFTAPATCAYLAQHGVAGADPDQAWDAVRALERTGLLAIDHTATPLTVRISRVAASQVHAALPGPLGGQAAQTAASALLEIWPQHQPQPWLAAGLRSCAARLAHTAAHRLWTGDSCHPLLIHLGHDLDTARLTGPAAGYWAELSATSHRILGADNPVAVTIGGHLAQALTADGQPSEAAAWWRWVATGRARLHGPDHPDSIAARVNLGHALVAAGQHTDAVTVLEQALADSERARGSGHLATVQARDTRLSCLSAPDAPSPGGSGWRAIAAAARGPRRLGAGARASVLFGAVGSSPASSPLGRSFAQLAAYQMLVCQVVTVSRLGPRTDDHQLDGSTYARRLRGAANEELGMLLAV